MKKLAATVLAALFSASAFAATAYMDTVSKQISWLRPDRAVDPVTKQEFANPSDGTLIACGFVLVEYEDCDFKYRLWGWETSPWCRAMNAAERQAVDDAEAQAQAAAEAAASLPAQFPTGIATTNAAGHWVEFVPDGTNVVAQTLAIQVSQSPLTPEQREAMKAAALAEREARKAAAREAKARGQLQRRIEALEALMGVE